MKLFLIATLIGVCAAGRLDHLERSYLPPDNSGKSSGTSGNYGSSFELGSSFAQQHGQPQNSFPSASNRYLPPVNGPARTGAIQSIGSVKGFGNMRNGPAANQQYSIPSTSYGTPQHFNSFNGQGNSQSQFGTINRQYLTPSSSFNPNIKSTTPSRQYLSPNAGFSQNGQQQLRTSTIAQKHQFGAATSRQYLAPSAASPLHNGRPQFGGSRADQLQQFGTAPTRQYLPPQTSASQHYERQQFGVSNNLKQQRFGSAASRQYLAPHSDAQASGPQRFGGSNYGQQQTLGASGRSQYFGSSINASQRDIHQQYSGSQKDYITPLASGLQKSGSSRSQTMIGAISRLYLPSSTNPFEGIQQQPFNERTGYQY